jgi:hypothetical protein
MKKVIVVDDVVMTRGFYRELLRAEELVADTETETEAAAI